jgi:hypothetical protein
MENLEEINMDDKPLLGDGADLTGRQVEYWGDIWTIVEKNYLGDWEVQRREYRPTGAVKVTCSIDPHVLPEEHPHYAKLVMTH